jgi:hypothetical protein
VVLLLLLLKQAVLYAAQLGFVTGRQIEVLLGSYIPHALFARGSLSVPSALYAFIRAHYYEPVRLWAPTPRVAEIRYRDADCQCAAGVRFLTETQLKLQCGNILVASPTTGNTVTFDVL